VPPSSGSNRLGWGAKFLQKGCKESGQTDTRELRGVRTRSQSIRTVNRKWEKAVLFKLFSRVPLSQYQTCTYTTSHCKYYCLLSGYWSSGVFRCGNLRFRSCCSSNSTRLDGKRILYLYWNNEIVDLSWYSVYKCFSLHLNTLKWILIVQLTFLNFNYE
jgi:hypothetical protein